MDDAAAERADQAQLLDPGFLSGPNAAVTKTLMENWDLQAPTPPHPPTNTPTPTPPSVLVLYWAVLQGPGS